MVKQNKRVNYRRKLKMEPKNVEFQNFLTGELKELQRKVLAKCSLLNIEDENCNVTLTVQKPKE